MMTFDSFSLACSASISQSPPSLSRSVMLQRSAARSSGLGLGLGLGLVVRPVAMASSPSSSPFATLLAFRSFFSPASCSPSFSPSSSPSTSASSPRFLSPFPSRPLVVSSCSFLSCSSSPSSSSASLSGSISCSGLLSRSFSLTWPRSRGGQVTGGARICGGGGVGVRRFHVHEYQAMSLLGSFDVPTPRCTVARTPAEAESAAEQLGGPDFVVKAQVLAGGRGKGTFKSGFQGGVHTAISALEARSLAAKMLNQQLVTKQTGPEGKPCHQVLVTERLYLRREAYFAILMDRQSEGPVLVASPAGGMDIEKVAAETPKLIFKEPIDIVLGPSVDQTRRLASTMGFSGSAAIAQASSIMHSLYSLFVRRDATLVEINPMAETHDGRILCVDAKLNFDDNAAYRQADLFAMRDYTQEDPREVAADQAGLNYIGLDGNIGCLVNGAGLAMATMDAIKINGGTPANFLDIGGGATKDQVTHAFQLLNADKQTKAILVNIFGGIMRCDVIALGLIAAASTLGLKKPVVIRLAGTNVSEAKKLIDESGMRMLTADDLGEAAQKAVNVVNILKMAEDAHVNVSFELPL